MLIRQRKTVCDVADVVTLLRVRCMYVFQNSVFLKYVVHVVFYDDL